MESRETYQAQMEKQLNEWKAHTERLKEGADRIAAENKIQYDKYLDKLRSAQTDAWDHFYKLKGSTEGAWAEFKIHMDKAGGEVKAAFEDLATKFKR